MLAGHMGDGRATLADDDDMPPAAIRRLARLRSLFTTPIMSEAPGLSVSIRYYLYIFISPRTGAKNQPRGFAIFSALVPTRYRSHFNTGTAPFYRTIGTSAATAYECDDRSGSYPVQWLELTDILRQYASRDVVTFTTFGGAYCSLIPILTAMTHKYGSTAQARYERTSSRHIIRDAFMPRRG